MTTGIAGVERTPAAPVRLQAVAAGSVQELTPTASADLLPEVAQEPPAPSQAPDLQYTVLKVGMPAAVGSNMSTVEGEAEEPAFLDMADNTAAEAMPAHERAFRELAAVEELPSTVAGVSHAAADGAAEGSKRKREAITWTLGGTKAAKTAEAKETGEEAEEEQPGSPKRLRPNAAFLPGLISGIQRTNERLLADNAANAACQGIAVAASGGAKAQLDRAGTTDHAKIRRAALSVATQQNLANCAALLKEIAAHYGFSLTVADDYDTGGTVQDTGGKAANGVLTPVSQPGSVLVEEDERSGSEDRPELRVLNPLSVRLGHKRAQAPQLQSCMPAAEPLDVRPKPSLALNGNRLAGAALSAINSAAGLRNVPLPRKPRVVPGSHAQGEDPQDGLPDSLSNSDNNNSPAANTAGLEEELSSADGSEEGLPLPKMHADREISSPEATPQRKEANGNTSGGLPAESGKEIGNLQGLFARAMHQKQQQLVIKAAGAVRPKRSAAVSWDDRLAEGDASDAGHTKASVERASATVDVSALFTRAMQQRQDDSVARPVRAGSVSLPAASAAPEISRLRTVQAGALPAASSGEGSSSEDDAAAAASQPPPANRKPVLRSVAKAASGAPDSAEAAQDRWQSGDSNNPPPATESVELGKAVSEAAVKPGQRGLRARGRPSGLFGAAMNSLGR